MNRYCTLLVYLLTVAAFAGNGTYDKFYDRLPIPIQKVESVTIPNHSVCLSDYDCEGNGVCLCTDAFQKAINNLDVHGGGRLVVPTGVWLTGPIELKDNIELHIEHSAIIRFSSDKQLFLTNDKLFNGRVLPCIRAVGRKNIAITGHGVIDGNGQQWRYIARNKVSDVEWKRHRSMGGATISEGRFWYPWKMKSGYPDIAESPEQQEHMRNDLIRIMECENVLIEGVVMRNSPRFHLHPVMCRNVIIDGITVHSPWNSQNTDGIDLTDCHRVIVVNNTVDVGDDGICLKSVKPQKNKLSGCSDIIVENNTVFNAHGGFVLGSNTAGGIRAVVVRNNSFVGTNIGLRFKSAPDRGGRTERIYINNIVMTDIVEGGIVFQCDYANRKGNKMNEALSAEKGQWIPEFQDIHMEGIRCHGTSIGIKANGMQDKRCIYDITIKNSSFVYTTRATDINQATTQINLDNVEMVEDRK